MARTGFFLFLLLAGTVLAISGCGRKTLPVPPQTVLPAPVRDLSYILDEKGLTLTWSYPKRMENGAALDGVDGFEISRAVVAAADYCAGCPVPFGAAMELSGAWPAADRGDGRVVYTESLLRPNHRYFYKVRSRKGLWGISRDSNTVSFEWQVPARAVQDLKVTTGDRFLELVWRPPIVYLDGRPAAGPFQYQVYRVEKGQDFLALGEPQRGNVFIDDTVENGMTYRYQVRAVQLYGETRLHGQASAAVSGTPRDMTPPAPPRNLVAVATPAGINLSWDGSSEEDLAGYRMYRRSHTGKGWALISTQIIRKTTFTDMNPPTIDRWYYAVTASDRATPANESVFSSAAVINTVD